MAKFIEEERPLVSGICEMWVEDCTSSLPKCPRCDEDITCLLTSRTANVTGKVLFNYETEELENCEPETIVDDIMYDSKIMFICPHCEHPVFKCFDDAFEFFETIE